MICDSGDTDHTGRIDRNDAHAWHRHDRMLKYRSQIGTSAGRFWGNSPAISRVPSKRYASARLLYPRLKLRRIDRHRNRDVAAAVAEKAGGR